jgi:hypothetical protein
MRSGFQPAIDPLNRLDWYRTHLPERYEWSKRQFLVAVSLNSTTILLGLTTDPQQLRPYYTTLNPQSGPPVEALPIPPAPRAIDILGLNRPRYTAGQPSLEVEVETYLNERTTQVDSALAYWQVCVLVLAVSLSSSLHLQDNQTRYPTIFSLAMDILPIQASAVPCERVFSSAKETMTPRRNRISPELMEMLQILKFSIKNGRSLNFTKGLDWADEWDELEFNAELQNSNPEDITSYIRSIEV